MSIKSVSRIKIVVLFSLVIISLWFLLLIMNQTGCTGFGSLTDFISLSDSNYQSKWNGHFLTLALNKFIWLILVIGLISVLMFIIINLDHIKWNNYKKGSQGDKKGVSSENAKWCHNCGKSIENKWKVCAYCGQDLQDK